MRPQAQSCPQPPELGQRAEATLHRSPQPGHLPHDLPAIEHHFVSLPEPVLGGGLHLSCKGAEGPPSLSRVGGRAASLPGLPEPPGGRREAARTRAEDAGHSAAVAPMCSAPARTASGPLPDPRPAGAPAPPPELESGADTHGDGSPSCTRERPRRPRGPGPGGLRSPSPRAGRGRRAPVSGAARSPPRPTTGRAPGAQGPRGGGPGAAVTMGDCARCSVTCSHQERRAGPRQTPAWKRAGGSEVGDGPGLPGQ